MGNRSHAPCPAQQGGLWLNNEELAVRIQAGENGLISPLWEQMRGLVLLHMSKLFNGNKERADRAGVEFEDLEHEGYFALLDAVNAFDESRGYKLSAYLQYPCRNRFNAAVGMRTRRQAMEPLNNADSLNRPISGEDNDAQLQDIVADPDSSTPFEEATERIWREQLRAALDECLARLPKNQEEVIRGRFYHGLTLKEIAAAGGFTFQWSKSLEQQALRDLRRYENRRRLLGFREDIISTHAYSGGLANLLNGRGSATERTVELLEELERQMNAAQRA